MMGNHEMSRFAKCSAFILATAASASDSTSIRLNLQVESAGQSSLLGAAHDGQACRYKALDGKIHCIHQAFGDDIAVAVGRARYLKFGGDGFGFFETAEGARYAFVNAMSAKADGTGSGTEECKLALKFLSRAGESVWIWHDELRYLSGGQAALIDTNADGQGDLYVRGHWTGSVYGSNRWRTADPNSDDYSSTERSFPTRPNFGKIGGTGRVRGCRPDSAGFARLEPAENHLRDSVSETSQSDE